MLKTTLKRCRNIGSYGQVITFKGEFKEGTIVKKEFIE